ncbi:MAG: hypothetical protein FD159_2755, partial [Syntrophaceae bacterium]
MIGDHSFDQNELHPETSTAVVVEL